MKLTLTIVASSILLLSGCNPVKSTATAEAEAAKFHTFYDAGEFGDIYDSSGKEFKASGTKEKVVKFMKSVSDKLGKTKSSVKAGWRANSFNLKTTVVLTYSTTYERGAGTETFTYRVENGKASLIGWYINSDDLVIEDVK
ncbi:MAG: hypothetical protein ABI162_15945 [Luteolibacter sp.]